MKGLFGNSRMCGVVASETAREAISQVRRGLRKTRWVRLDYFLGAKERDEFLTWVDRKRPGEVLIATCRRKEGGGAIFAVAGKNCHPSAGGALWLRLVRCGNRNGEAFTAR